MAFCTNPLNDTEVTFSQTTWSVPAFTTGVGTTVTSTSSVSLKHPFAASVVKVKVTVPKVRSEPDSV